jgi:DNA-binding XRE family transcriptional regulator
MMDEIKHRGRKPKEPTVGFGANLRRLRTERGLNQTQLAESVGVVQSHIANIEVRRQESVHRNAHPLVGFFWRRL